MKVSTEKQVSGQCSVIVYSDHAFCERSTAGFSWSQAVKNFLESATGHRNVPRALSWACRVCLLVLSLGDEGRTVGMCV